MKRLPRSRRRIATGHIAEFAPALLIFIVFLLVPLIALLTIPLRCLLAQAVVNDTAHRLSLHARRSEAYQKLNDQWLTDFFKRCSLKVKSKELVLIAVKGETEEKVLKGQPVPAKFLPAPDGKPGEQPGSCVLELKVKADLTPVAEGSVLPLPALTKPVEFVFVGRAPWENLGCDPATGQYYINE